MSLYNKLLRQNSNGFTFIEIIIVISLTSFLSIAGLAAFTQYTGVQTFNSGVQDVYVLLQQAKSNAQSQVKPAFCTGTDTLHGYRVSFCSMPGSPCVSPGGFDYQLEVVCGGADYRADRRSRIIGKQFPVGVSLDIIAPSPQTNRSWFLFTVLRGGVLNSSNASNGMAAITDTSGRSRQITVDTSGRISVN